MSIEPGIYRFKNGANEDTALELYDGEWSWGTVGGRNQNDSSWMQRWMVLPHPQDPGLCNIFNVQCGALLGVFSEEQHGHFKTKAGPANGSQDCALWRVDDDAKGGNWKRFLWHHDSDGADSRALDVAWGKDGQRGEACKTNGAPSQTWNMERANEVDDYNNFRCYWMRNIPGDTRLTRLNIPGTHETQALFPMKRWRFAADGNNHKMQRMWLPLPGGTDNPICNDKSLYEQMCDGVRHFDLRLDVAEFNGEITCYGRHGLAEQGYPWWAELQSMVAFVRRFQKQTVFASIRYEKNEANPVDRRDDWIQAVTAVTSLFAEHIFFTGDRPAGDITLDEVRGKVIIFGDNGMPQESMVSSRDAFYSGDSSRIAEDAWDMPKDRFQQKVDQCRDNIERAKGDESHWYCTACNMSGTPAIVADIQSMASKFGGATHIASLKKIEDNPNQKYDPVDFFDFIRPALENDILSEERLGRDGQHRVGLVEFDFYNRTQVCVDRLIRSNLGCGGLE